MTKHQFVYQAIVVVLALASVAWCVWHLSRLEEKNPLPMDDEG